MILHSFLSFKNVHKKFGKNVHENLKILESKSNNIYIPQRAKNHGIAVCMVGGTTVPWNLLSECEHWLECTT